MLSQAAFLLMTYLSRTGVLKAAKNESSFFMKISRKQDKRVGHVYSESKD